MNGNIQAFADLMAYQRQTEVLAAVAERLGWDQETMMPAGAAAQRGEEMGAMEGVLHARRCDPRIGDWLAAAAAPDEVAAAQLYHIRRAYDRATKIPGALAEAIAVATSAAQGIWAGARASEKVADFLPVLQEVINLRRQEAECLAQGGDLYDALLDVYEPGANADSIGAMFGAMLPRLRALRAAVLDAPVPEPLRGTFPQAAQLAIARELATAYGYDWHHGRMDLAVHPFSAGTASDSRITTRVVENDPFNCFYSTIHEVGHSSYELNIAAPYKLTPLGRGVSMGVHESQSRIYENQIGRSRGFTAFIHDRMVEKFGDIGLPDAEAFYRAVNRVHAGYVRTEADELHYNLHIILRFDLERALIRGDLAVGDLEAAWNDRFVKDFGVAVDRPRHGMLQDVHWAVGLFGYFPTYSLGNVYAGCLLQAMRRDLPDWDSGLSRGDTSAPVGWLRENLQRHGGLRLPRVTVQHACGFAPSELPLLDYLEAKFGDLYRL